MWFALGGGCRLSAFAVVSSFRIFAMYSVLVLGGSLERGNGFIETPPVRLSKKRNY